MIASDTTIEYKIDKDGRKFPVRWSIVDREEKKILTAEGWKYYKKNFWGHFVSPNGEPLHWFNTLRAAEQFACMTMYPRGLTDGFDFVSNYSTFEGKITEIH